MRSLLVLATAALLTCGCRKLDLAPEDADGALAWLFEHQPDAEAEAVLDAVRKVIDDLDLEALEDPHEGLLSALGPEAVASVGRLALESLPEEEQVRVDEASLEDGTYVRLEDQQGMVVVSVIPCPWDEVAAIHVRLDQDEIHGDYDSYERVYTSDFAAWEGGGEHLAWQTVYVLSVLNNTYEATILGQLRRVEPEGGPAFALGRAHLPDPADFHKGGGYFRQDYHLDLFFPLGPDRTLRLFAVWRDLRVAGFHSSNAAMISTVSKRLVESDETVAALCHET